MPFNVFFLENFDVILCIICFFAHLVVSIVHAIKLNKKITALCEKCGSPVVEGVKHDCSEAKKRIASSGLSKESLEKLYGFIDQLVDEVFKEIEGGDFHAD